MSKKASEFQEKVMPLIYSGKGIFKPLNTGKIDGRVKCVREYIANIFFYTKNGTTVMIDAGYNYPRLKEKMGWLGLDPKEIKHILITHQDTDHVGAVERDSDGLFTSARLYIGETENKYLTGERKRKVMFGLYTLPQVTIDNPKRLVKDGEIFYIENIKIECFLTAGHTFGHINYLLDDKYLFTGDTLWFGADGGYSFINALAEDNGLARKSLAALKEKLSARGISPVVITGHTGWTDDFDFAFAHIDKCCNSFAKQRPVDPKAPFNGYNETDDTRQNADMYLEKAVDLRGVYTEKTRFWDKMAAIYDLFPKVFNRRSTQKLCAFVANEVNKTDCVLECACGTGMLTEYLAPLCGKLYATDLSLEMLKKSDKKCRKFKNVKFKRADITKLKFPDNYFDTVIAANVIHLLDSPQTALNELLRVCRPGGKVIIPTYIAKNTTAATGICIKAISKAGADFKKVFSYDEYKKFFADNGVKNADFLLIEGRVPCAVVVIVKTYNGI